ncbi:MAG: hypothetical protein L3J02_03145 [Henriciella sp.]|nr:hypothetical protein [Henriciella sp.]
MAKKWIIAGVAGVVVVGGIVGLTSPDPEYRITGMCEGYYEMVSRKEADVNISKDDRANACAAVWVAIEKTVTEEDLKTYVDDEREGGNRVYPSASESEARLMASELRKSGVSSEEMCEWAESSGKPEAERDIFCDRHKVVASIAPISDASRIAIQLRGISFEAACAWAESSGKPEAERAVFCAPIPRRDGLPRYVMF